jgi:rhombotail lipoprotein
MKERNMNVLKAFILLLVAMSLTACTGLWHNMGGDRSRSGVSSSLVDFLYPRGEEPPPYDETVPQLNLPLRVGLAFVPSSNSYTKGLSEAHKLILLNRVKTAFKEREFIKSISIIPDTYLRSAKGFKSMDQIARIYGLDTIALVSYDQISHTEDTKASILYWTIIGAYFIKGSVNDVQTFVDTSVFDVKTHKLLFRAPGIHESRGSATLVNSIEETRKRRAESFDSAMEDMTQNLNDEMNIFVERVKTEKVATVVHRPGYSGGGGGGALGWLSLLALMLLGWRRRYNT